MKKIFGILLIIPFLFAVVIGISALMWVIWKDTTFEYFLVWGVIFVITILFLLGFHLLGWDKESKNDTD